MLLDPTLTTSAIWVCAPQIRSLADDVLRMVKETDALIDDLPGLDKTERWGRDVTTPCSSFSG